MIKCIHKTTRRRAWHNPDFPQEFWKECAPFFVNPRGILTHRAKSVTTHTYRGEKSHHSVDYWCGSGCCFELGFESECLVECPPDDRLLCHHCEARATAKMQPKADKLIGRHIHTGKLTAYQTCCLQGVANTGASDVETILEQWL